MTGASLRFETVLFSRGEFNLSVNTDFPAGALSVILGPSGCGKTTLLDLAAGFLQPGEGRILEGDLDVTRQPPEKRRMGVVFQDHALFPHMSVKKNILFGPLSRGVNKEDSAKRAAELIQLVRLEGYEKRRPASLSGGEKQRVALARALAIDPDILLLDEPFSALDAALRREMRAEVRRIQRETGITAVLVTHDQDEALAIADHLVVMNNGSIVGSGTPAQLWNSPDNLFTALFLGRSSHLAVQNIEHAPGGLVLHTAAGSITLPSDMDQNPVLSEDLKNRRKLVVVIRPESLTINPEGSLSGRVMQTEYAGGLWKISVSVGEGISNSPDAVMLETRSAKVPAQGESIRFTPDPAFVTVLPECP